MIEGDRPCTITDKGRLGYISAISRALTDHHYRQGYNNYGHDVLYNYTMCNISPLIALAKFCEH